MAADFDRRARARTRPGGDRDGTTLKLLFKTEAGTASKPLPVYKPA